LPGAGAFIYHIVEGQAKYNAIMHALGSIIYREMLMNP